MMSESEVGASLRGQEYINRAQVGLKFRLPRIRSETIGSIRRAMRVHTRFVVFFVTVTAMAGTAVSRPLWSTLAGDNYLYPTSEVNAQPQYLPAYQSAHSPYYVYNVHASAGGVPTTIFAGGKPEVSQIPAYGFYYGMPIYDIGIPLSPVYPVLTLPPRPLLPPTSTQKPIDVDIDDDGIEKLDSKVDSETKKPASSSEDRDSITVEAI
ncbi:uncharacterized protein LOC116851181 [Odontomachus brunneus]|uniref:uncharacterized protein LOC116851181 n=1 Tax=Odontomachus brunneus TaxID=486640 RepID=UPI0013F194ED|nr:uncharacterized protein LOC116851181 [Odontomachus brunneus]